MWGGHSPGGHSPGGHSPQLALGTAPEIPLNWVYLAVTIRWSKGGKEGGTVVVRLGRYASMSLAPGMVLSPGHL